jgi:hypothetical protein
MEHISGNKSQIGSIEVPIDRQNPDEVRLGFPTFFAEELFLKKFWIEEPCFEKKNFFLNTKLFFNSKISNFLGISCLRGTQNFF